MQNVLQSFSEKEDFSVSYASFRQPRWSVTQPTSSLDLDQMLYHWATRHLWELHCKAT